jgi:hypothetical protein
MVVLLALAPPTDTGCKILELKRLSLGVILPTLGQRLLIVPHLLCRTDAVEKQNVGGDRSIGRKNAIGQADDSVKVKFF